MTIYESAFDSIPFTPIFLYIILREREDRCSGYLVCVDSNTDPFRL